MGRANWVPILSLAVLCATVPQARACLRDSDTIAAETARFPGIRAVMTGAFARHSREFYEWRKSRSQSRLAADPSLVAEYDDLAVAQHKLGDHHGAIATMLTKDKLAPGRYETYSNLGTFYIYTGELELALATLDKALALNAEAHFGREKYQRWLVQWMIEDKSRPPERLATPFSTFLLMQQSVTDLQPTPVWRKQALAGIAGMMRFADFDNPILQQALGDVLLAGDPEDNAAQLAAKAYVFAMRQAADPTRKAALARQAAKAGEHTQDFSLDLVGQELDADLRQSTELAARVRSDEMQWLASGKDAAVEFERKYFRRQGPASDIGGLPDSRSP